jgi:nucleotide-binding universal stress UspA family protein
MMGSVTEKVLRTAETPLLILHSFRRTLAGESVPLPADPVSFKSMLVPIDPGEASLTILPWIEKLAAQQQSKVVLFHVRPSAPPPTADAPGAPHPSPTPPTVQAAEERLRSAGVNVRTDVVSGSPPQQILETAASGEFDLLAMSTHARSPLERWMLGSIAERILRHCPIPMLVVPSRGGGPR